MSEANRFNIFTFLVIIITGFLLFTEVYERIDGTIARYTDIGKKEKALLTPDEYAMRLRELRTEKLHLTSWAKNNFITTQTNQASLFGYLYTHAKHSNVIIHSITPQESKTNGRATMVPFSMTISAKYHSAAKFINSIETESIPISITTTTLQAEKIGNPLLMVTVHGQARLLSEL